jgi:hypothetical protein
MECEHCWYTRADSSAEWRYSDQIARLKVNNIGMLPLHIVGKPRSKRSIVIEHAQALGDAVTRQPEAPHGNIMVEISFRLDLDSVISI